MHANVVTQQFTEHGSCVCSELFQFPFIPHKSPFIFILGLFLCLCFYWVLFLYFYILGVCMDVDAARLNCIAMPYNRTRVHSYIRHQYILHSSTCFSSVSVDVRTICGWRYNRMIFNFCPHTHIFYFENASSRNYAGMKLPDTHSMYMSTM